MKVAIAQIKTDPGEFRRNTAKIVCAIQEAKKGGAELLVFPELAVCGYAHMDLALNATFVEANWNALRDIADHAHQISVVVGFIDKEKERFGPNGRPILYNSAAVIEDGSIKAIIDKTLLPTYDIFSEHRYFSPGKRQGIVQVKGVKLGIGICEDLWDHGYSQKVYPDLIAQGADLLVNISCSPFHCGDRLSERCKVIERAISESNLPFIYANLVGSYDGYDGEIVFDGRSLVFGRERKPIVIGSGFKEEIIYADLDKKGYVEPPEANSIKDIYQALTLGITDYFRRTGLKRAYIGLSGGIDSSVVAVLAQAALGSENVIGVTMPSAITSKETRGDAELLAGNLAIECRTRSIESEYNAWFDEFVRVHDREPLSITKQNKQARIRGAILMEYTNQDRSGLVLTTGNKTELALGYCTLYGDMCGGLGVISDVNKERVYSLASFINDKAGYDLIPESVLLRAPTAELEPGQTDAANLPADYDVLSPLVDDIIDKQLPSKKLNSRYSSELVKKTLLLIHRNEFKRRQAAPGIRITAKAFGVGRRYPSSHQFFG